MTRTLWAETPRAILLCMLGLAALPAFMVMGVCLLYCALLGKLSTWVAR